jgi:murein DD-endopeptidase MepM/ murein hydrolase activator NlpD
LRRSSQYRWRQGRPFFHFLVLAIAVVSTVYGAAGPLHAPTATSALLDPTLGLTYTGLASAGNLGTSARFASFMPPQAGVAEGETAGLFSITSSQSAESGNGSTGISESLPANAAPTPDPATPQAEPDCDASHSEIYCVYTVQPRDTLSLIADRFGLVGSESIANWELLVESNRPDIVSAADPIQAGQNIRVPLENGIIHLVLGGESLGTIAEAFGVSVDAIAAVAGNGISAGQTLVVGQEILVPSPTRIGAPAVETPQPTAVPTPEPPPAEAPAETAAAAETPLPTESPIPVQETPEPTPEPDDGVPEFVPSEAGFIWPVSGAISSYFGPGHPLGIDIDLYNDANAPIVAAATGIVTFAGGDPCCSYGLYVIIDHGNGYRTLYGHLSAIAVSPGQVVSQGDLIGYGGQTGYATGNHLHFEVHLDGDYLDPLSVLP